MTRHRVKYIFIRMKRIKGAAGSCYHVMSRVAGADFLFGDREKEIFRKMMWKAARFSGVEILTYAVMSNHFHIVVRVPLEVQLSDAEILKRCEVLYRKERMKEIRDEYEEWKRVGQGAEYCRKYQVRMYDISAFMKTLKQRYSIYYNAEHKRVGTLWQERFRSVLVEAVSGDGGALETMCAYVDLNAVRAGLVTEPEAYRWCGFAEALAGRREMLNGLASVLDVAGGAVHVLQVYRRRNFAQGDEVDDEARLRRRMLQQHVRYFSYGGVMGARAFVDGLFNEQRWRFGALRKTGARTMKGAWRGLCVLRDLQVRVIS